MQSAPLATVLLAVASLAALVIVASLAPSTANEAVETVFEFGEGNEDAENTQGIEGVEGSTTDRGRWQRRLLALSEESRLSPREREVFYLLAKGRNAEHVSKTLFISPHTAKTHIYRIYRKLDVNTQQELIDKFDAARL
jgi:DNA-binding CsgD family transcriptional regulator